MKPFTPTILFAFMARLTHGAPAIDAREPERLAEITFYGADSDAGFQLWEPLDGSDFDISMSFHPSLDDEGPLTHLANQLSISRIRVWGNAQCWFDGVDGSRTFVTGGQLVDVGPPQTQVSGFCWPYLRNR
jgi:hypothetical protein